MSNERWPITVERLQSGFFNVRSRGPCNFTQVPWWPCDYSIIETYAHPEASKDFLLEVDKLAHELIREKMTDEVKK